MSDRSPRYETCAGGVVFRREAGRVLFALAEERDRLTDAPNTRLAKGHLEPGETVRQAALREVREEIGLTASIVAELGTVHYTFVEEGVTVRKEVHFFLMQDSGSAPRPLDGEMRRVTWCPAEDAATRLTFDTERDVAQRAREAIDRLPVH
jgi:8-oxo-dGTP pyrophosphatase MutT (NUDIX family)